MRIDKNKLTELDDKYKNKRKAQIILLIIGIILLVLYAITKTLFKIDIISKILSEIFKILFLEGLLAIATGFLASSIFNIIVEYFNYKKEKEIEEKECTQLLFNISYYIKIFYNNIIECLKMSNKYQYNVEKSVFDNYADFLEISPKSKQNIIEKVNCVEQELDKILKYQTKYFSDEQIKNLNLLKALCSSINHNEKNTNIYFCKSIESFFKVCESDSLKWFNDYKEHPLKNAKIIKDMSNE